MTGLDFLMTYLYDDISFTILQIIDDFNSDPKKFADLIKQDSRKISQEEYSDNLKVVVALVDHLLQSSGLDIPNWIRSDEFRVNEALYLSRTRNSFDVARLIAHTPAPFKARNIYIEPSGLERV